MDVNLNRQGEPGYCNPKASPGDLFLQVDGQDIQNAPLSQLHDVLRGNMRQKCEFSIIFEPASFWRVV